MRRYVLARVAACLAAASGLSCCGAIGSLPGNGDGGNARAAITKTVKIAWEGDSYVNGVGTVDGPRRALDTMLRADLASGVIPGGPAKLVYIGSATSGTEPTNHHTGIGGSQCADHLNGGNLLVPSSPCVAIADLYGQGKPVPCPDVWIDMLAHNDGVPTFESATTGKVPVETAMHTACPNAIIVSASGPGTPNGGIGVYDQMDAWMTSTGWPALTSAGIPFEPCHNPCQQFVDATDMDPATAHPNTSGNLKIATALRTATDNAVARAIAAM